MQIGFEKIEAPTFKAGSRRRIELPQTGVIHNLVHRLKYGITTTGGTGAGAPFGDAAYRAVEEFRILAGKVPLQAIRGQTLRIIRKLMGEGANDYVQTNPTDDAAGTESNLESWIELLQGMPWSFSPHMTGLPASALSVKPVLEVAYADAEALFTSAADGAFAFEGNEDVELYMELLQGTELPEGNAALARRFPPLMYNYYDYEVSTSQTDAKIRLDGIEQGDEVRCLIVETFAGGVNGALYAYDDAVVEEVRLEVDDEDVYGVIPFVAVQQRNAKVYGLSALETGVAVIDAAEDKVTSPGALWQRRSRTSVPTPHIKTSKQAGDNLVRVTTATVRR